MLPGSKTRSPEYNMGKLLDVLTPSTIVPEPDKYYVFVYRAKTPNIVYDQHPFVICQTVFKWGFIGANLHHGLGIRQYTWAEIVTNLYEVSDDELNSVEALPIAKIVRS